MRLFLLHSSFLPKIAAADHLPLSLAPSMWRVWQEQAVIMQMSSSSRAAIDHTTGCGEAFQVNSANPRFVASSLLFEVTRIASGTGAKAKAPSSFFATTTWYPRRALSDSRLCARQYTLSTSPSEFARVCRVACVARERWIGPLYSAEFSSFIRF